MLGFLDGVVAPAGHAVDGLAGALAPVFGSNATATSIVLATLVIRLLLLPLSRTAARNGRARQALQPLEARLRRQHAHSPGRLARELAALRHEHGGGSQVAAMWPMLAQVPFFIVLYRLFSAPAIGANANLILTHSLLGVPLGGRFTDLLSTGPAAAIIAPIAVYAGLFVVLGLVAWWSSRQARATFDATAAGLSTAAATPVPGVAAMAKVTALLPFGTLIVAAVMPLAVGLYLATTTAWSATERWAYQRGTAAAIA